MVVGGSDGHNYLADGEINIDGSSTWTPISPFPFKITEPIVITLDNRVFLIGNSDSLIFWIFLRILFCRR